MHKNVCLAAAFIAVMSSAHNLHAQPAVVVTPIGAAPATVAVPAAQQVTTVTTTMTGAPATGAAAVTVTTATAVAPAAAVVAAPATTPAYGNYHDVPARALASDGTISNTTARFLLTADDPTTTANMPTLQLILTPAQASAGLFVNRADLPEPLEIGPLVDMEMLFIPLGPDNFRSDFALDMLRPDGNFNGHAVQLTGPTGQPLAGFGLIFESVLGSTSSPTTGTAITYAGGNILIPNSNLNATTDFPDFSILISDPANGQAYRLDSLGVHVVQKQARDADGITQVKTPFLNDASTTSPRLELYTGTITNTAGQPVAHQPFRLDPPYEALLHISLFNDTPSFYTGTDGRFSLVFDTKGYYAERGATRSWSPLTLTATTPAGPQEFPVQVGQDLPLQMQ